MKEVRKLEKNSISEKVAYMTQYVSHLVSSRFDGDSMALTDTYAGYATLIRLHSSWAPQPNTKYSTAKPAPPALRNGNDKTGRTED